MERKKSFGQEVKSLRKRLGWSQKDLANKIPDISTRTLGKIERGEKPFLDHTMVSQLADALHLDGLTREEFFSQAGLHEGASVKDSVQPKTDAEATNTFYRSINFPAYIHDSFLTLHSANAIMLSMFGLNMEDYRLELFAALGPHIVRTMFEMQFEARTNWAKDKAWKDHAEMIVYRFRLFTRRHVGSQQYIDLLAQLKRIPEFREIWLKIERTDYVPHFPTISTFHLKTGEVLHFIMTVATDTSFVNADANKVIFIPADSSTRQFLANVASKQPYYYLIFDQAAPQGYTQITP